MSSFGITGYFVAAIAWTVMAVMLLLAHRARPSVLYRRLFGAAAITACWAAALALAGSAPSPPFWVVAACEFTRNAAWLYVLLGLAPELPRFLRPLSWAVFVAWVIASAFVPPIGVSFAVGGFALSLLVLLLTEQVYRNSATTARDGMKLVAIGLGGVFTFDIFLYAQSQLLSGLDGASWQARGYVNALLVPLLTIGVRRLPGTDRSLFVSRHVAFYTTTFLAVGVYLLLMAGAGYAIREFGGFWGETARAAFLVVAFALLILLVTSAAMHRRLRVFVSKHFYRNKYDYRIEWLRFIRTLSGSEEADPHRVIVQAVAQTLDAPQGVLFTLTEGGRRFAPVSAWPRPLSEFPALEALERNADLVEFMRRRRWIVDLDERRRRPSLYEGLIPPPWLEGDTRWRIVSPVVRLDTLVGFFVLFSPPPPFELSYEDRDLLHTMGQHVATLLAQHEADRRVAELSQFETYNRLTAFVMHDLKNCAAQLSLVVGNAAKHRRNPEFIDDAIATIANTSERITRLIEHLSKRSRETRVHQPVRAAEVVSLAVARCQQRMPAPTFAIGADSPCMIAAEREQLAGAIEHVVRNAQEATDENGRVEVALVEAGAIARISVRDDGQGMDAEFVQQQLFRPFTSTKGSKGMGIGAYQAREFARSLGGDVEVDSRPGAGTNFSLILPVVT